MAHEDRPHPKPLDAPRPGQRKPGSGGATQHKETSRDAPGALAANLRGQPEDSDLWGALLFAAVVGAGYLLAPPDMKATIIRAAANTIKRRRSSSPAAVDLSSKHPNAIEVK